MGMGVKVKVWGDYALFSRPEMKVERCSYDVMTPSAARGILEAIYWHPGLRWVIDRIYVQNPIRFTSVRRNEVKSNRHITEPISHFILVQKRRLCKGHRCFCVMSRM